MNNTKIIFYDCYEVYKIFEELNNHYLFNIENIPDKKRLDLFIKSKNNYLIVTDKCLKEQDIINQVILDSLPININKLIEKINIALLRNNFLNTSNIKIGKYFINKNSREILFQEKSAKLTEQEIKIIAYLNQSLNPVPVSELQEKIWGYNNDLETHTVETHIYRLRQKIFKIFKDNDFLLSLKNGYYIKDLN
jgi:hypothetical protein